MQKLILNLSLFTLFIGGLSAEAQIQQTGKLVFGYDQAGNRVSRHYQLLRVRNNSDEDIDTVSTVNSHEFKATVFPNPTSDKLITNISVPDGELIEGFSVRLFDSQGRLIFANTVYSSRLEIDISTLASGTYFLRINAENQVSDIKIIKE